MVQVLHVYKEVELLKTYLENGQEQTVALLSYDEKPGIQAIKNTSPEYQASLDDLPRQGKPATIPADAKAWVLSLACQKPKELGYAAETWTVVIRKK